MGREPHPNRQSPNKAAGSNRRGNLHGLPIAAASASLEGISPRAAQNQHKDARIHNQFQHTNKQTHTKPIPTIAGKSHQNRDPTRGPGATHQPASHTESRELLSFTQATPAIWGKQANGSSNLHSQQRGTCRGRWTHGSKPKVTSQRRKSNSSKP